jgi:hypothetical protein
VKTMLLDRSTWDLAVDASGNIGVAEEPYAVAQDAASAIRLFLGELWYDTTKGVPYFEQLLGHQPPLGVLKAALTTAALTVPEVESASVFVTKVEGRQIFGQVQVRGGGDVSVISGNLQAPIPA